MGEGREKNQLSAAWMMLAVCWPALPAVLSAELGQQEAILKELGYGCAQCLSARQALLSGVCWQQNPRSIKPSSVSPFSGSHCSHSTAETSFPGLQDPEMTCPACLSSPILCPSPPLTLSCSHTGLPSAPQTCPAPSRLGAVCSPLPLVQNPPPSDTCMAASSPLSGLSFSASP